MKDEYRAQLGIDDTMKIVKTETKWQERKGQDSDIDFYDVFDASGALIAKCEVWETVSMFPPQRKSTELKKFTPEGALVFEHNMK